MSCLTGAAHRYIWINYPAHIIPEGLGFFCLGVIDSLALVLILDIQSSP